MRPVVIALFAVTLGLTSACSHSEPKLADEFAAEDFDRVEAANVTPEQEPVETQSLGDASQPAYIPPAPATTRKVYKKASKKRRNSKYLAKGKKKSRKNRNRR